MIRIALTLVVCGIAFAAGPARAQSETTDQPATYGAPVLESVPVPPALSASPESAPAGRAPVDETKPPEPPAVEPKPAESPAAESRPVESKPPEAPAAESKPPEGPAAESKPPEGPAAESKPPERPAAESKPPEAPAAESKPPESPTAESKPPEGPAAESKPPESAESRYTFSRVQDGYVRLDNRTGQVSFCSKRAVGWTCQLAPEDRGVFENEVARLQEENAALKRDLLRRGLPLPGAIKPDVSAARGDRTFALPRDPDLDRIKIFVEKVWRRLVDLIVSLQKDVLKKS